MQEKTELSSFSFEYESGHLEFHSRLKIIISSGKIVHWKIPKKTPLDREKEREEAKIREIEISNEKLRDFIEDIRKRKIWDLENCTERALPDTPMLTFRIKNNEQLVFEQQVWENCRNDSVRAKELIRTLGALLPLDWPPP
ncbi:hypothetical protein EU528_06530 [Candidatus Thorarchaeota archaeon]|nr:MAG: hypothetical protein EU528_06530 [Candidatus Thorarchaeota archaeon]